jgi:hypothetical protein
LHFFTDELSASEATDKLFDGSSLCYFLQEVLFKYKFKLSLVNVMFNNLGSAMIAPLDCTFALKQWWNSYTAFPL